MAKGRSSHPKEFREKVAQEAIESGNQRATAEKYDLKPSIVYGWVRTLQSKDKNQAKKNINQLQKELEEKDLEIRVLKELLKKTTQTLIKD